MVDPTSSEINKNVQEIKYTNEEIGKGQATIEQSKVAATAEKLGSFFKMPEKNINQGRKTQAFYVSDDEFYDLLRDYAGQMGLLTKEFDQSDEIAQEVAMAFGTTIKDLNNRRQEQLMNLEKRVQNFGGLYLHGNIYIKKTSDIPLDTILRHEILHALVSRDNDKNGFQNVEGRNHFLNEGVIQTLELAERYNLSPFEMLNQIHEGKINTPYKRQIEVVLLALGATEHSDNPMTYQEVAKHLLEGDATLFKLNLLSRGATDFRGKITELFIKEFGI